MPKPIEIERINIGIDLCKFTVFLINLQIGDIVT